MDPSHGKARVALLNEVIAMITIVTAATCDSHGAPGWTRSLQTHSHMQPGVTVLRTESKVALCAHWN